MRSGFERNPQHSRSLQLILALAFAIGLAGCKQNLTRIPDAPLETEAQAATTNSETAVFSGGCFWGVDAVFKHVKGVTQVMSGYSGGSADTAQYETVSSGTTGHAESVQVIYDPSSVSYRTLLKVFFFVAHDPTELNRQGPDEGTQYRSIIFYTSDQQKKTAQDYIAQLDRDKPFSGPIVTEVVPLKHFYPAEDYHQDYFEKHPKNPYIVFNDWPKVSKLQKEFPSLYKQYNHQ
jgi:peptide-methionine (S)-S-oxide reductase